MARKPSVNLRNFERAPRPARAKHVVRRNFRPAPRTKNFPRPLLLPVCDRVASIAHYMAYQQMLRHHIVPYPTMTADYGIDHLTLYDGSVIKRVQIKGQEIVPENEHRLTFSIRRSRAAQVTGAPMTAVYDPQALDAFIFVHIELHRYFIMPMSEVQQYSSNVTFSLETNARWENAWDVLMQRNSA